MQRLIIGLLFFIVFKPFAMSQNLPALGDVWQGEISANLDVAIFNNIYRAANICVNNVDFLVAVDATNGNKVKGIITKDARFNIRGKKIIGKRLGEFDTKDKGKLIRGAGYYVPLTDGWYARFDFKNTSDSSKCTIVIKCKIN